ncbi:uncharacterized protein LOC142352974 isoform X3 [Convolutriloba macropyga]|uniref:uncharacterized protein LOC142352974 isoform X3 n=1 Tax=Convolutriloba macropyga TaxID=536237 RepID=UPI003F522065
MSSNLRQAVESHLVVLPSPPRELVALNPFTQSILSHNNLISSLLLMGLNGLVVRRHPKTVHNTPQTSKTSPDGDVSFGCLFIPAPISGKVFIFKMIEDLSKKGAGDQIYKSIQHQLRSLNEVVEQFEGPSFNHNKVEIQIVICSAPKAEKTEEFQKVRLLDTGCNLHNSDSSNISSVFIFTSKKKLAEVIARPVDCSPIQFDFVEKLIEFYIDNLTRDEVYLPGPTHKFLGGEPVSINQIEKVVETFNYFFPDRDSKLESIPAFNRMLENMLYCYTEEGKLGKFNEYAKYLGEVKLFSEMLLAKFEKSCGVLIRGLNNEHLKTIAKMPENSRIPNFEIDWLYLGKKHIVAFEVGLSENPEKAKQSSVSNKLKQCLTRIIPQMQLIIYSFWDLYSKNDTKSIADLLKNTLKVVVCLPNIKYDIFEAQITSIKEEVRKVRETTCPSELVILVEKNWAQVSNYLSFLLCNSSSDDLVWLRINEQLNVVKCDNTIDELFDKKTDSSESVLCKFDDVEIDPEDSRSTLTHSFIDYVSACLASAALSMSAFISDQNMGIEKTALDVDQRYQESFKVWRNKKFGGKYEDHPQFNFVLSPQQHRILLDESITHLILTGQPGTGKTLLLLAKCEQLASRKDIDRIFYFYDEDRRLFRKHLDSLVESNCSQELKSKLEVKGVEDFKYFNYILRELENSICRNKIALMIEEMEFNIDDSMKKCLHNFGCCWISSTGFGHGTYSKIEGDELPAYFKHENLNILFRSASHISTITSKYIEKQRNELPFPVEAVQIPGCFLAEQRNISVRYVQNAVEYLFYGSVEFLGDNFSSRLIVIISSDDFPTEDKIGQLKLRWKATEVVLCEDSLEEISGSEFQSVLLAVDIRDEYILDNVTMAISRAQYEVEIIFNGENSEVRELLSTYLSPESNNYSTLFYKFLDENITFTNWLEPQDSDMTDGLWWWESELGKLIKGNSIQIIMRKPITIRLQLTAAFPRLFTWPSLTTPPKLNQGPLKYTIVSCEDVECVNDGTICALNLLYWCVVSVEHLGSDGGTTKKCIELLGKRNVLSHEINRRYPQATLFDILVRLRYGRNRESKMDILLGCNEVESSTLTNKFEDKNVFEYSVYQLDLFCKLFSNRVRCDWFFMEYLGFENEESEERRVEKYKQWGGDILFSLLNNRILGKEQDYEALELGVDVLRRYNILQYEISRIKDGMTLLHWVLEHSETLLVDSVRLMVDAGFPHSLILRENDDNENV